MKLKENDIIEITEEDFTWIAYVKVAYVKETELLIYTKDEYIFAHTNTNTNDIDKDCVNNGEPIFLDLADDLHKLKIIKRNATEKEWQDFKIISLALGP